MSYTELVTKYDTLIENDQDTTEVEEALSTFCPVCETDTLNCALCQAEHRADFITDDV